MNNLLQTQLRRNGIYMRANEPNSDDGQNGKIHILLFDEEMCGDGHGSWAMAKKYETYSNGRKTNHNVTDRLSVRNIGNIGDPINSF